MSYTNALFSSTKEGKKQLQFSTLTNSRRALSTTKDVSHVSQFVGRSPSLPTPFNTTRTIVHEQRSPRCPNCSSIAPSSSSLSSLNFAQLPLDIDDCHSMIQSLRQQLVNSRGRAVALEDELISYRDQSLALQLASPLPTPLLPSMADIQKTISPMRHTSPRQANENFGDVISAMQRRVDEQSAEIQRLVEEKADLKRAAHDAAIEASSRLETERKLLFEERIRFEKNQQELALKLGKEAALTAFAAATLKQDTEGDRLSPISAQDLQERGKTNKIHLSLNPVLNEENTATSNAESRNSTALNIAEHLAEDKEETNQNNDSNAATATSPKPLSANELLLRHEHIRQQEMLLLALKQQQQQTKALVLAQQRQQAMLDVHGITLNSYSNGGFSSSTKSIEYGGVGRISNEDAYPQEQSSYRVPPLHPIQHQAQLRLQAATNKMLYTLVADQPNFNQQHQQNEVLMSSLSSTSTSSHSGSNGGGQYGFTDRNLQPALSQTITNDKQDGNTSGKPPRIRNSRGSVDHSVEEKSLPPQQPQQQPHVSLEQQQRLQMMQQQINQRAATASSISATNSTLNTQQSLSPGPIVEPTLAVSGPPSSASSASSRTRQAASSSVSKVANNNSPEFATNEVAEQRMQKAILLPGSPLAGIIPSRLFKFANVVELNEDLTTISLISGWIGLPPGATTVWCQSIVAEEPMMGFSIYQMPPPGTPWPSDIPFFAPLVAPGIPFIKHGRLGKPKKRVMFLDISNASDPTLMWHEGDFKEKDKVKAKDCLRLIDIADIRAGRSGAVLQRSGVEENAGRYICFCSSGEKDGRTLDIELPSNEARDFLFRKFADLFQAYATAAIEKRTGDSANLRVAAIVDGGANSKPGSVAAATIKK